MDQKTVAWLRPGAWVFAIALFILGAYSDTNTTEFWGWGFALLTAGFLVAHLPDLSTPHD
jgi:hypothetical protein